MALTLIATPGSASANSYATVAEAEAVAAYRVPDANTTAFLALTGDQPIQALVTATRDLDSIGGAPYGFLGECATDTQALEWPRSGVGLDGILPPTLVQATIELAISKAPLFAADAVGDALNADQTAANIKREKTDKLETEYFAPRDVATTVERFPPIVQRLLASLLRSDAPAWGSATVERGS